MTSVSEYRMPLIRTGIRWLRKGPSTWIPTSKHKTRLNQSHTFLLLSESHPEFTRFQCDFFVFILRLLQHVSNEIVHRRLQLFKVELLKNSFKSCPAWKNSSTWIITSPLQTYLRTSGLSSSASLKRARRKSSMCLDTIPLLLWMKWLMQFTDCERIFAFWKPQYRRKVFKKKLAIGRDSHGSAARHFHFIRKSYLWKFNHFLKASCT